MSQGLFFFLVFPKNPCMHLSSHPCMLHTRRISFFLIWLLGIYFVRCKDDLTVQPWSRATVAAADNFSDILRTEESNLRMVLSSSAMTASVRNHIPASRGKAWRWLHDEGAPQLHESGACTNTATETSQLAMQSVSLPVVVYMLQSVAAVGAKIRR